METDIQKFLAVFDTGATHHVFYDRKYFITFKHIAKIPVKMANRSTSSFITGIGNVAIKSPTMQCKKNILKDIFLCKTLRHSLISGILLVEEGGIFYSVGGDIILKFQDGEMFKAKRNGRRWGVEAVTADIMTAAVLGNYMLWHRRLGHSNDRTLKNVIRDSTCVGLPEHLTKTIPCEDCAVAKSTKISNIGLSLISCDKPLSVVVADLMGPFPVKAIGGYEFALEVRDIFLTYNKTYFLKNKFDVPSIIKTYIPEAERMTGMKLLYWRTDRGGEFINKTLGSYFREKGIHVQKTMPYFHEQNGNAERANRTAQSTMRVFLKDSKLPRAFWRLAICTGTYLHN